MYSDYVYEEQKCQFSGLKKKHKSLTKSDVTKGVKHFSIVNCNQTRTFMSSEWEGMINYNNQWYPKGYKF
jgi:hypothetical protein